MFIGTQWPRLRFCFRVTGIKNLCFAGETTNFGLPVDCLRYHGMENLQVSSADAP